MAGGPKEIYTEGTVERLDNNLRIVIKSIGLMKAMVGDHYIPIPLTYIAKDKTYKRAMSYNKLNIRTSMGHSKIVFINGTQ